MKHSTLRLSEHQPYLTSSLKFEHLEIFKIQQKAALTQSKDYHLFLNKPKQLTKGSKQKRNRRIYNHSNLNEQLPLVKQNLYNSKTVISDRNDNQIYKTTASNSDELVSKYSFIQADYNNGISSGKKISPIKLQKHLWKLSLQNLIKSQYNCKTKKIEEVILPYFVLK